MGFEALLGEALLLSLAVAGWVIGYGWNKNVPADSPDSIRLPRALGVWFGGGGRRKLFDARGVWLQGFWMATAPVWQLRIAGILPERTAVNWTGAVSAAILILVVLRAWRKGSFG